MRAIAAVIDIAVNGHQGRVSGRDIERRLGLSKRYLEKALQDLTHRGVLIAERGKLGGYQLARAASHITVEDVLLALRAESDVVSWPRSSMVRDIVIPALDHVARELSRSLRRITIQDLTNSARRVSAQAFNEAPHQRHSRSLPPS
jgi:Rrf2 family protein